MRLKDFSKPELDRLARRNHDIELDHNGIGSLLRKAEATSPEALKDALDVINALYSLDI